MKAESQSRHRILTGCLVIQMMLVAVSGHAATVSFSADVKRSNTNQKGMQADGRIMVSEEAIRTESQVNGEPLVVIYQSKNKQVFTLLPAKGQFSRVSDGRLDFKMPPTPRDPASPCQQDKHYQCQPRGMERIDGRTAEAWQIYVRGSSEKDSRSFQLWVDVELGVAIRERYDDGMLVEMQNIRVGPQDGQLFKVPAGYQEVVLPAQAKQP
ncbi:MAG: hypothetical protein G8345_09255 [Magnetococcales bacterium]|nr:hypothetical protein [Magnetococcales bacterium]